MPFLVGRMGGRFRVVPMGKGESEGGGRSYSFEGMEAFYPIMGPTVARDSFRGYQNHPQNQQK